MLTTEEIESLCASKGWRFTFPVYREPPYTGKPVHNAAGAVHTRGNGTRHIGGFRWNRDERVWYPLDEGARILADHLNDEQCSALPDGTRKTYS